MAVMPHSYELNFRSDSQPTDGLTQTVHHIADQCICLGKENKIFNSKLLIKVFKVSDLFNPLLKIHFNWNSDKSGNIKTVLICFSSLSI